eukprot:TRINITY_DN5298_c0_g1_i1.p1 TRINITY_DN5298_c0_g1~~TRINITY_DN5298_c0_g1_i1.p1  ORF type:complete len:517 (+),score=106.91 TRINITY_DN5298_c0_g1_i1:66-1616(+)
MNMLMLLGAASAAPSGHNLLFMMADQMRADAFGKVNPRQKTPNIDQLADDGIMLKAYTSTPSCTPARAAILTGQKPWNHGMLGYGAVAQKYPYEMPRTLDAAGYSTTSIGKDHFGWNTTADEGVPHGYQMTNLYDGMVAENDDYHQWFTREMPGHKAEDGWPTLDMNSWMGAPYVFNSSLHPTAYVGRAAVKFIKENLVNATKPWFLKVSFHRPHSPYDPPQDYLDQVQEADLLPTRISTDGWDKNFSINSHANNCGPQFKDAWCGDMPAVNLTLAKRAYYGSIRFVDTQVGLIIAALKETSNYDNTLIVWTADHGDGQGDHYHFRKTYPYEESAAVPMIVRWPVTMKSIYPRGSQMMEKVTELRDIFPTMLDGAGLEIGSSIDGQSLLCIIDPSRPQCKPWRQWIDLEHSTCYNITNHWNALTDGRMKYIFNAYFPGEQLFNLTADPYELVDIAAEPAYESELKLWRGRMVAQFEEEKRGPTFVLNGVLQQRVKGQTYSPNYPSNYQPEPDINQA